MEEPKIAGKAPVSIEVEEGKTYAWCACGQSSNQPFCDGSHGGTEFSPKVFKAEKSKTVYMCMCKHTSNPGFCDGSHKQL
ncbi:MAG: CDGSH iron-sulfur domain-containing protein [Ekhidna sp.]|uniref:CDGSH iron-sulfur domain-containing protein n=1 Tax=Ekhidna sp. TaxID=2608089 RepID=UPI0032EAE953